MRKLSPQTRDKLKKISTATLTTALFKRGLRRQMIQDVHPLNPKALPITGEAFTLRYIPAREDLDRHPALQALDDEGVVARQVVFQALRRGDGYDRGGP